MEPVPPFGALLRETRMAQDMSLGALARRTHYSKGYLSRVENGLQEPSVMLAKQCDAALGADGRLQSLVRRPEPPGTEPDPRAEATDAEDWVLAMNENGAVWFEPMRRRRVITSGAAWLAAVCAPGSLGFAPNQQVMAVEAFGTMFGQLRTLGQQLSPGAVLPTLVVQTNTLRGIAKDSSGDARAGTLRLAARYAEYTGWMTQEAGQDTAAMWWTDLAAELAAAGGDREMAAHSLVRRALVTLYAGDAAQTVELARRAQDDRWAGARVRGLAAQREAQGHAIAGATTQCLRALDRATELLSRAEQERGLPVLGSSTVASTVALTTAWCLHDLGRPAEAADLIDRELREVAPAATRFRARWGARRALAYAMAGEVDHACDLAGELLPQCATADSATIRSDVRDLTKTLARWLRHPKVRAVYPALTGAQSRASGASR
jgi:transcriptional regulator with XRE-family HTH domain